MTRTLFLFALGCVLSSTTTAFAPSGLGQRHRLVHSSSHTSFTSSRMNVAPPDITKIGRIQKNSSTSLCMSAGSIVTAAAAITGAISGGVFSGGLHAISGPDHLAALLPRCCGQRWYRAGRIGALWGMGHGMSATLVGMIAFAFKKGFVNLGALSKLSFPTSVAEVAIEVAVGFSLIVVGLLGIKEAREWEAELDHGGIPAQSLSAAAADAGVKTAQKRAVIFNGLLHGFSWDGAPSLAPALAVATWRGNLTFLLAYAMGTMGAMMVATTLIGEGTRRTGEWFNRPDIPQKLSFFSSILAMVVGGVWCGLAFLS